MISDIYTTLQGIIFNELPKNTQSQPIIFDKPIGGWYYGDRSVISETPGIVFQGVSSPPKDAAFGTKMIEHTITVSCWIRADSNALVEQQVIEFSRLIHEALLPHRKIWVLAKCPLCPLSANKTLTKWTLSPQHYIIGHSGVLGKFSDNYSGYSTDTYVARAKSGMDVVWQQTHTTGYSGHTNSGLSVAAFNLMYEDVRNSGTIQNLSTSQKNIIQSYQTNKIRPIRLLFDGVFSDVKPCQENNDKGLFRGGEFTFTAKELIKVSDFGPDNVPTNVWG